ncbi:hypothetical protein [Sorangium sp. So ce406]|uniref:hypothetical protein n=1 Tax=Sorangium sp. So ce406 TaxID=3133311 RepID=UPI003F5B0351
MKDQQETPDLRRILPHLWQVRPSRRPASTARADRVLFSVLRSSCSGLPRFQAERSRHDRGISVDG